MSDQAQGSKSGSVHWSQIPEETVFCNTNGEKSKLSFNPSVLINNVPKPSKNVDVYNGHDQGLTTTTFGSKQRLLSPATGDNICFKSEISLQLNSVGSLQELCMAHYFPLPIYTFSNENLKNYNERFTVTCSLYIYSSSGAGSNKQAAKKKAAYLMYKQLQKLTPEELYQIVDKKYKYRDVTRNYKFFLCCESVTLLKTFFGSIDAPKAPNLQNIKKNSNKFKLTAVDTLKMISEKDNFTLKYDVISQNKDEVEVLMQVNTIPIIAISGSGKNKHDAEESASRVILAYLKLKLKI